MQLSQHCHFVKSEKDLIRFVQPLSSPVEFFVRQVLNPESNLVSDE